MRGQFFLRVEDQLTKIEKSEGNRKPPLNIHRNNLQADSWVNANMTPMTMILA